MSFWLPDGPKRPNRKPVYGCVCINHRGEGIELHRGAAGVCLNRPTLKMPPSPYTHALPSSEKYAQPALQLPVEEILTVPRHLRVTPQDDEQVTCVRHDPEHDVSAELTPKLALHELVEHDMVA